MVLNPKKDAKYFVSTAKLEDKFSKEKRWVLITGASGGIGSSYAMQLAAMGFNLFLTSSSNSIVELNFLKEVISKKFSVSVKTLAIDLSNEKEVNKLINSAKKINGLTILINNAGFGVGDEFIKGDLKYWLRMIQVHNVSIVKITHALLPQLLKQKKSYLINVSSLAGFFPFAKSSIYSATKLFLISFSESLHLELKNKGLKVQALTPGFVKTKFFEGKLKSNNEIKNKKRLFWMMPDDVVKKSLYDLKNKKNKVVCIPGFPNRLMYLIGKLTPRKLYYFFFRACRKSGPCND